MVNSAMGEDENVIPLQNVGCTRVITLVGVFRVDFDVRTAYVLHLYGTQPYGHIRALSRSKNRGKVSWPRALRGLM